MKLRWRDGIYNGVFGEVFGNVGEIGCCGLVCVQVTMVLVSVHYMFKLSMQNKWSWQVDQAEFRDASMLLLNY